MGGKDWALEGEGGGEEENQDIYKYIFWGEIFSLYLLSQATPSRIGFMHAPQGRKDAPTQNIRPWNWKKSFYSICTSRETGDTK